MAKTIEKQKALSLRKLGKSYSQIKKEVGVSKSTLSNWLREYPLSDERIRELRDFNAVRIEKYRNTMRKKREKRLRRIYNQEVQKLLPLTKKELYIAELFLYWGEGVKGLNTHVGLNNTDPRVVKFFLLWLVDVLGVQRNKVRVYLHLYSDMDVNKMKRYWSKRLGLPLKQFNKPYIKKSDHRLLTHKGFAYGTCGLYVYNARLKEKIIKGIEVISDRY